MAPAKLTVDPLIDLEGTRIFFAQTPGCEHIRVRKHGDLIILESGPEKEPVRHARLRRVTKQWWMLEMGISGTWEPTPFRAPRRDLLKMLVEKFPWVLANVT
jgi:hypothetical protein